VGLVYLPILTPLNLAYDARWYHLPIAEGYAAYGGIHRFPEGWFPGANPQLASYLYSWAFCIPGRVLFDQIGLSAHLEFGIFLATLAQVPVLVRRLNRGGRPTASWVAVFAFPGLFLYDASLSGGADHIAAFWAIPIFLVLLRAYPAFDPRYCAVLGALASGALTKYTSISIGLFPALAMAFRGATFALRATTGLGGRPPHRWLYGALALAVIALVCTAPHWLKNIIFYGDPVYPHGYRLFPSTPWTPDSPARLALYVEPEWIPERSWDGVLETLGALVTFSFVPHDWYAFHRDVPVFGSLFTLSVPCLLLLRRSSRLIALYTAVHVGIAYWFWTYHQDRYLQAFLPWMAAGVSAIAIRLWQEGWLARIGVWALGGIHAIWSGDVPFIPGHAMVAGTPLKTSIDLISTGYRKQRPRFDDFGLFGQVRRALPEDAVVLLHEEHLHLGIGTRTVSDWVNWQGGINYGRRPAPHEVDALLRELGVTHLLWARERSLGYDSMASDIAFFHYVTNHARNMKLLSGYALAEVPASFQERGRFRGEALLLTCAADTYRSGVYRVSDLTVTVLRGPRPQSDFPEPRVPVGSAALIGGHLGTADAVVHDPKCFPGHAAQLRGSFVRAAQRQGVGIWVRRLR